MSDAPHPEPATVCDTCGAPETTRFADETLCVDCYAERGACCADEADACDEANSTA
jgi:hypothetical protein